MSTHKSCRNHAERVRNMTAIYIIEYQANYSAAAFLMPRVAVFNTFEEIIGQPVTSKILQATDYEVNNAIKEAAKQFDVNYTAMKYGR